MLSITLTPATKVLDHAIIVSPPIPITLSAVITPCNSSQHHNPEEGSDVTVGFPMLISSRTDHGHPPREIM